MATKQTAELRTTGIGGSDASVIMGLNPYKTPLQLYMEKTGATEGVEDSEAMYFGRVLEDVIASEYARRTGSKVARVNQTLRHPDHEWMMAHIDRRVLNIDDGKLLECKTAGKWWKSSDWGRSGSQEAPLYYQVQIQHYLAVTGWQYADIAALLAGNDFRIYHFDRDEEMISRIIEAEAAFWKMVEDRTPPDPSTVEDINALYPVDNGEMIAADEDAMEAVSLLSLSNEQLDEVKKRIEKLKLRIQAYMGEKSILADSTGKKLHTWKTQETTRIDTARIKAELPDIYRDYSKTTTARVFR